MRPISSPLAVPSVSAYSKPQQQVVCFGHGNNTRNPDCVNSSYAKEFTRMRRAGKTPKRPDGRPMTKDEFVSHKVEVRQSSRKGVRR
jgi:hypothetical protein